MWLRGNIIKPLPIGGYRPAMLGLCSWELESERESELGPEELRGVSDEDWKHKGFDEAQHLLGSARPALYQLVTQMVAAGKSPGQSVRT